MNQAKPNRTFQLCGKTRTSHTTQKKHMHGFLFWFQMLIQYNGPHDWFKFQEPELKDAGIVIPDHAASKKSFTVYPSGPNASSIQVLSLTQREWFGTKQNYQFLSCVIFLPVQVWPRWVADQLYVNELKGELYPGMKRNAKGGVTMSTAKYGGWKECFTLAKKIANWTDAVEE